MCVPVCVCMPVCVCVGGVLYISDWVQKVQSISIVHWAAASRGIFLRRDQSKYFCFFSFFLFSSPNYLLHRKHALAVPPTLPSSSEFIGSEVTEFSFLCEKPCHRPDLICTWPTATLHGLPTSVLKWEKKAIVSPSSILPLGVCYLINDAWLPFWHLAAVLVKLDLQPYHRCSGLNPAPFTDTWKLTECASLHSPEYLCLAWVSTKYSLENPQRRALLPSHFFSHSPIHTLRMRFVLNHLFLRLMIALMVTSLQALEVP